MEETLRIVLCEKKSNSIFKSKIAFGYVPLGSFKNDYHADVEVHLHKVNKMVGTFVLETSYNPEANFDNNY